MHSVHYGQTRVFVVKDGIVSDEFVSLSGGTSFTGIGDYNPDTMTYASVSGGNYDILTDTQGDGFVFSTGLIGSFVGELEADGTVIINGGYYSGGSYIASGGVIEVPPPAALTSGGTAVVPEVLAYTKNSGGEVTSVALKRYATISGGSETTVETATLTYSSGGTLGITGDLVQATVNLGTSGGALLSGAAFEYYLPENTSGTAGQLEMVVDGDGYFEAIAASGGTGGVFGALYPADYASNQFVYLESGQTYEVGVAGAGSSLSGVGQGWFTYAYTVNPNYPGGSIGGGSGGVSGGVYANTWYEETTETGVDSGSELTVFTNGLGEVMLTVELVASGGSVYLDEYYEYDSAGRLIQVYDPTAMSGYSTLYANLVNTSEGEYTGGGSTNYLSLSGGLVTDYSYGTTTTASLQSGGSITSGYGSVTGYLAETEVQEGEDGTAVPIESWNYYQFTYSGDISGGISGGSPAASAAESVSIN